MVRIIDGDKLTHDLKVSQIRVKRAYEMAMGVWDMDRQKECLWAIMSQIPDIADAIADGKYDIRLGVPLHDNSTRI